jgi:hypothetical protein
MKPLSLGSLAAREMMVVNLLADGLGMSSDKTDYELEPRFQFPVGAAATNLTEFNAYQRFFNAIKKLLEVFSSAFRTFDGEIECMARRGNEASWIRLTTSLSRCRWLHGSGGMGNGSSATKLQAPPHAFPEGLKGRNDA